LPPKEQTGPSEGFDTSSFFSVAHPPLLFRLSENNPSKRKGLLPAPGKGPIDAYAYGCTVNLLTHSSIPTPNLKPLFNELNRDLRGYIDRKHQETTSTVLKAVDGYANQVGVALIEQKAFLRRLDRLEQRLDRLEQKVRAAA